ncbi:hypothetical protein L1049_008833 [Liquidambar formosana]|uniref:SHSP domain-containing protein n=1 Tax=Liquidambar formosana TaxID=63359 RepID=A0AAP0SA96_LIQFO
MGAALTLFSTELPLCKWQIEEEHDTLLLSLPADLDKGQLKVQIKNSGILSIIRKRPVDESKDWSGFNKLEIKIQENWRAEEITAKLEHGDLHIVIPKKIKTATPPMKKKAGAVRARFYDDFEPVCEWQGEEEGRHSTLVFHLPNFEKNQLKVQLNNHGILTITGERPMDETKWSRFRKEIGISKRCKANEIHAKFVGGLLSIKMPRQSMPIAKQDELTLIQLSEETGKPKPVSDNNQDKVTEKPTVDESSSGGGDKSTSTENAAFGMSKPTSGGKTKLQSLVSRLKMDKKVAVIVAVGVAMVVVVALGAFLTYRRLSSDVEN